LLSDAVQRFAARRWAIMLDDGGLVFVDSDHLGTVGL
jgi:hypothetical protein